MNRKDSVSKTKTKSKCRSKDRAKSEMRGKSSGKDRRTLKIKYHRGKYDPISSDEERKNDWDDWGNDWDNDWDNDQ